MQCQTEPPGQLNRNIIRTVSVTFLPKGVMEQQELSNTDAKRSDPFRIL